VEEDSLLEAEAADHSAEAAEAELEVVNNKITEM
jgi:hypothetical protein